jgi:hypothetical protein
MPKWLKLLPTRGTRGTARRFGLWQVSAVSPESLPRQCQERRLLEDVGGLVAHLCQHEEDGLSKVAGVHRAVNPGRRKKAGS